MFFKELETDRLFLKNISLEDREFIFTLFSDNKINKYLFDAEPLTDIQEANEIIGFYIQEEPREQHRWVLVRKSDGIKLGTCGFHCWDKLKSCCDVGYELLPNFWGIGYMNEAIQKILEFAQNDMKVNYINACVYVDNEKSIKLIEKYGFIYKGKMKDEIFRGEKYPHKIFTLDCTVK